MDLQAVALVSFVAGAVGGGGLIAFLLAHCPRCAAWDSAPVLAIQAPSEEAAVAYSRGARVVLTFPSRRRLPGLERRSG